MESGCFGAIFEFFLSQSISDRFENLSFVRRETICVIQRCLIRSRVLLVRMCIEARLALVFRACGTRFDFGEILTRVASIDIGERGEQPTHVMVRGQISVVLHSIVTQRLRALVASSIGAMIVQNDFNAQEEANEIEVCVGRGMSNSDRRYFRDNAGR